MKKFLSLLAALFIIECFQAHAEKRSVVLERYLTGHLDKSPFICQLPLNDGTKIYLWSRGVGSENKALMTISK